MNFEKALALLMVMTAVILVGYWGLSHYFSEDAVQERRRRRSNRPVTTKTKRPTVKFSVRTKQKKD